ncbi:unnamed protein product, partial [Closterium sp. Yama58-4]
YVNYEATPCGSGECEVVQYSGTAFCRACTDFCDTCSRKAPITPPKCRKKRRACSLKSCPGRICIPFVRSCKGYNTDQVSDAHSRAPLPCSVAEAASRIRLPGFLQVAYASRASASRFPTSLHDTVAAQASGSRLRVSHHADNEDLESAAPLRFSSRDTFADPVSVRFPRVPCLGAAEAQASGSRPCTCLHVAAAVLASDSRFRASRPRADVVGLASARRHRFRHSSAADLASAYRRPAPLPDTSANPASACLRRVPHHDSVKALASAHRRRVLRPDSGADQANARRRHVPRHAADANLKRARHCHAPHRRLSLRRAADLEYRPSRPPPPCSALPPRPPARDRRPQLQQASRAARLRLPPGIRLRP